MKRHLIGGIVSSIATALTGCATTSDIAAVRDFEPERYMGTWYEIARLPQYFERVQVFSQEQQSSLPTFLYYVVLQRLS